MFLLLLLAVVFAWTFLSCSKSEESHPETGTARTEEQQKIVKTENVQGDSSKRVDKPERTLIFGEEETEEERAGESAPAESDSEVRAAEPSAVLQRNAAFLERSGSTARYPFDLIIGKLAPYESLYSETEGKGDNDNVKVAALGERFLRAAFDGKMNVVKQLSSPAAQDSLSVQVKAWETQDVQIEEIRIGAIHLEDATARFDFRVFAQIGRGAGNAVAVFAQDRWTLQAIEFDVGRLQDEYVPPEYTDFPVNYDYFTY